MKKNVFLSFFIVFFSAITSNLCAQGDYNGFNLKDYYTPDIVRSALELNFNLNGNASNSKTSLNTPLQESNYESKEILFSLNNSSINFLNLRNTRKIISTLRLGFSPSLDYHKYSNSDTTFTFGHSEQAYWNNRLYYNPKYFISYNASLSLRGGYHNKYKDGMNKDLTLNFTPSVGWGMGRIENVTDARQAVYILEEFKKNGVLSRDMTKDEIFEFAQLISTVKNKRFLDSRLHRIDEMTTIDNYLKKKDVLSNSDATYFTSLYDMWEYGALFDRSSGSVLSFTIVPSVNYNWDYTKNTYFSTENNNKYLSYNGTLEIDYNYSKPVKLNWQHDFSVGLNVNVASYKYLNSNSSFTLNYSSNGRLNYKLGYYPNTRTNVYAQVGYNTSYSKLKDISGYGVYNGVNIGGGLNYYVSQNLRLSANFNLNNSYQDANYLYKSYQNFLSFSYGLSFRYLFF